MTDKVEEHEDELLTLANLGNGGAAEQFEEEMVRVLENILDPNTPATDKRQIVIKVTFKPSADRDSSEITVDTAVKLASVRSSFATVFVGRRRGKAIAITHDPKQMQFRWDEEDRPRNISRHGEDLGVAASDE